MCGFIQLFGVSPPRPRAVLSWCSSGLILSPNYHPSAADVCLWVGRWRLRWMWSDSNYNYSLFRTWTFHSLRRKCHPPPQTNLISDKCSSPPLHCRFGARGAGGFAAVSSGVGALLVPCDAVHRGGDQAALQRLQGRVSDGNGAWGDLQSHLLAILSQW